ncbi:MAG: hypothetical protein HQ539_00370 [Parcubacteria group bacterium]|nr:hypothetical protein [Parcubacteria group bacterium]
MNKYHKNLTPEKWQSFSKSIQILNVCAELSRAKNWLIKKNERLVLDSLNRAFELIDLTTDDEKWRHGLNELLRFREVLADFYLTKNKDVDVFISICKALLYLNKETALVKI